MEISKEKIPLLNTYIHDLTMSETISIIKQVIQKRQQIHHVVVNAGKIVAMQTDQKLRQSVNNSDLINADGQAVVWASKFLNKPLRERVTGIDLMQKLVEIAYLKEYKIFFFGAKEEVVKNVVEKYEKLYSPKIIAGFRNGYYEKGEEKEIAQQIVDSGAQLLFVAITSPKKENFLNDNKEVLKKVNFIMGVGGSFDVVAGLTKRAPVWMQKNGLEWFYRFMQEPKRMWKRYLIGNTKFIILVLKEKMKQIRSKH